MKLEKITDCSTTRRSYGDACAAAHALDLVGERWALLVVRELLLGPKRFVDLKSDLPGISANVLTQRLEGLEAAGIVVRKTLPPPAAARVYELTAWGSEAEPIFQALGRWAARSPSHDPTRPLSATSLMLSLRTMFDPARAGDAAVAILIAIGRETFAITVRAGALDVVRGAVTAADITLAGAAPVIAALIYGAVPTTELEASGALDVAGDRALLTRLVTWFPLPDKASS